MVPYGVITADCPWPFRDKLPGPGRGAAKHYRIPGKPREVMTWLRKGEFLPPIADDALLFFWRVGSMQQEAINIMRSWGFSEPKSEIVWVKVGKRKAGKHPAEGHRLILEEALHIGMGHYVRNSHEICLIGRRGKGGIPPALRERSVIFAPVGAHSEKPEAFYRLVERMTPGARRIDLFARKAHEGFEAWGDEAPAAVTEPAQEPVIDVPQVNEDLLREYGL